MGHEVGQGVGVEHVPAATAVVGGDGGVVGGDGGVVGGVVGGEGGVVGGDGGGVAGGVAVGPPSPGVG